MIPNLDQLADEAIERRANWIGHSLAVKTTQAEGITLALGQTIAAITWSASSPALDALADARLATIARLAEHGITPEPETDAAAGDVRLDTIQDAAPVQHRYTVCRPGEHGPVAVGAAWLTAVDDAYTHVYVARADDIEVYGSTLAKALQRLAQTLADTERADRLAGAR